MHLCNYKKYLKDGFKKSNELSCTYIITSLWCQTLGMAVGYTYKIKVSQVSTSKTDGRDLVCWLVAVYYVICSSETLIFHVFDKILLICNLQHREKGFLIKALVCY